MAVWGLWWDLRRWLNEDVFCDPQPSDPVTARRVLVLIAFAVLLVGVQLARMWPSKPLDSIWAEDGYVWLSDATRQSLFHTLTTPYNGYLQTTSRLIAEPVSKLPTSWYAAAMAITGASIVAGYSLVVWSATSGYFKSSVLRVTLVMMVVLLPIFGVEILANVTYSTWFLLFTSFWILLWRPNSLAGYAVGTVLLFLAAVSNAEVAFLLPLWLIRVIAIRNRRETVMMSALGIGLIVQFALTRHTGTVFGETRVHLSHLQQVYIGSISDPYWRWSLVPAYLQRIVSAASIGQRISGSLWVAVGTSFVVLLGVGFILLIGFAMFAPSIRTRVLVPLMVFSSIAMFLFSGYHIPTVGVQYYWSPGKFSTGSHYMVVPTLLLLSALLLVLDDWSQTFPSDRRRIVRTGASIFVLVIALLNFNAGNLSLRGRPTWTEAQAVGHTQCLRTHRLQVVIPVAPVYYAGMRIDCRLLSG